MNAVAALNGIQELLKVALAQELNNEEEKKTRTVSFRITQSMDDQLSAAMEISGASETDLIIRCIKTALGNVVQEIKKEQSAAMESKWEKLAGKLQAAEKAKAAQKSAAKAKGDKELN